MRLLLYLIAVGLSAQTLNTVTTSLAHNGVEAEVLFSYGGQTHAALLYDRADNTVQDGSIAVINLATNAATVRTGVGGRYNSKHAVVGSKFVFFGADPGNIGTYDLTTNTVTDHGWWTVPYASEKGVQSSWVGPDNKVYVGMAVGGGVARFDPATGTKEYIGLIDPPDASCTGCYRYAYQIYVDANYIYTIERDVPSTFWWLNIQEREAPRTPVSCYTDLNLTSLSLSVVKATGAVYVTGGGIGGSRQITAKECPTAVSTPATPQYQWYETNASCSGFGNCGTAWGYEFDTANTPTTTGAASLRYRLTAGTWQTANLTGINTYATNIKRVVSSGDSGLLLAAGSYGPTHGLSTTRAGWLGAQSTYNVSLNGNYVMFGGYASSIYKWTPASTWTWSTTAETTCSAGSPSNPCKSVTGFAHYNYYSALGSDGLTYYGSKSERDRDNGGYIGWVNPATNAYDSWRCNTGDDTSCAVGTAGLKCHAAQSIAMSPDGSTVWYSSNASTGQPSEPDPAKRDGCNFDLYGALVKFDTTTKQSVGTYYPNPNMWGTTGKLVAMPDGGVLGIIKDTTSRVYRIGPDGTLRYNVTLAFSPFNGSSYDYRPALGGDGYVYLMSGTTLYKINPADGAATSVKTGMSSSITGLYRVDGDKAWTLYSEGGTALYSVTFRTATTTGAIVQWRGLVTDTAQAGYLLIDGTYTWGEETPGAVACTDGLCRVTIPQGKGDLWFRINGGAAMRARAE
jgi:hypothetical protein